MLIAYLVCVSKSSMTDSMNFGPEWLRNLSSEGSTGGGSGGGARYQLAEYRYGREEMLALFEKGIRSPNYLTNFTPLYSEQALSPLALVPHADEERLWQSRSVPPGGLGRGRGGSLERGGRISRGRGPYQTYGRSGYEGGGGWGNGEPSDWSPRKDYGPRAISVDNWRRNRAADEDEGWRTSNHTRGGAMEKWGRSTSWRDGGDGVDERGGPPERGNRTSWHDGSRGPPQRRTWDNDDHLPEWATENPSESGGSFDATGAFHGSDDEQRDQRTSHPNKREIPLQKSVSQQNITTKVHPTTLPSSQSALSLSKPPDIKNEAKENLQPFEIAQIEDKHDTIKEAEERAEKGKLKMELKKESSSPERNTEKHRRSNESSRLPAEIQMPKTFCESNSQDTVVHNRVEEDFDRLQEDLVQKLVVDEDKPKKLSVENFGLSAAPPVTHPPPNLVPPVHEKWFYQDPQGDLQGPFLSTEMAEWFRAGYFTVSLLVKRQCDETYYRLGDLVNMTGGNPFQSSIRIAPLKQDVSNMPDSDVIQYQMMQRQFAIQQAATMRSLGQTEPWNSLSALQQRDLAAQQMVSHPQVTPDIQFLQQQPPANLIHMISQMQHHTNKLPNQTITDKSASTIPTPLDPLQALVQQMGGLQGIPSNIPSATSGLPPALQPSGLPSNLSSSALPTSFQNLQLSNSGLPSGGLPGSGLTNSGLANPGLPVSGLTGSGLAGTSLSTSGLPAGGISNNVINNIPAGLSGALNNTTIHGNLPPRPNPLGAVDPLSNTSENEAIKSFLRQLQTKTQTQQLDTLWQQNQFPTAQPKHQWQQQNDVPISMWDMPIPTVNSVPISSPSDLPSSLTEELKKHEKEERQKELKEINEKEFKKRKELEQKLAKKEAEEKRKEEQRRQELEKKAAEEDRKREEERIRRELEKVKKEAEEKRLRELEEKRRLKEQRKAEEEERKKSEEQKKIDEEERSRREAKERDELLHKQSEVIRENNLRTSRAAPWCQTNVAPGASLAEIQKAEREKRAEQAALIQQQRAQQMLQEQQAVIERSSAAPFNWAKKPPEPRKVKSLAEIQQEEQERLTKQVAEARLAYLKEKETSVPAPVLNTTVPWNSQNLSWANTASQWNNSGVGFWDEVSVQKSAYKPSSVSKSNSTSTMNAVKQSVMKQSKSKTKKEEQQVMKLFSNGPAADDFMDWCTKALAKLNSTVDIPTFISFLRDIESALDVREYCKEYLGESPATQQFATQFLEKRRLTKPKTTTQKDDMSSPAPAITPTVQHNTEFQEVKGKGKKTKKSKMMKVDARILGFSVTAAPDRLNVGDRDYVDN